MLDHFIYMAMIYGVFAIGAFLWKKLPMALRLLVVLMGITCVIETMGFILLYQRINNYWLFHLMGPLATVLLLEIFREYTPQKWKIARQSLRYAAFAAVVVPVGMVFTFQPLTVSPDQASLFLAFLIIAACLWFFFLTIQEPEYPNIWQVPIFWVAFGSLLFYSGTFFVFGFLNLMIATETGIEKQLFNIVRILNFVMYPCYAVAFLMGKKNK